MIKEIDFQLFINKTQEKGFVFRNDDGTYYDLTDAVVNLNWYRGGENEAPVVIQGTVTVSTASVIFRFESTDVNDLGVTEYVVVSTKVGVEDVLTKGNITVSEYLPFSTSIDAFLQTELPEGVVLSDNFVNQKIMYWRLFLQDAFNISDSLVQVDSAWPVLVNALIAKLIAYEALTIAIRGSLMKTFGSYTESSSSSSSQGGIKSIETGPTKVEFLPAGDVVTNLAKATSAGSNGLMEDLKTVMCGLASKLQVKLPMCKAPVIGGLFQVYRNVEWEKITLADILEEPLVSRG